MKWVLWRWNLSARFPTHGSHGNSGVNSTKTGLMLSNLTSPMFLSKYVFHHRRFESSALLLYSASGELSWWSRCISSSPLVLFDLMALFGIEYNWIPECPTTMNQKNPPNVLRSPWFLRPLVRRKIKKWTTPPIPRIAASEPWMAYRTVWS